MKAVLLVRPDIFNLLGLQNQNTKLRDNSVLLDWRTTYPRYRQSELFSLADRLLSHRQNKTLNVGESWDYYFPFKTVDSFSGEAKDSFVKFLRFSLFRPRDIVTMLDILKKSALSIDSEANIFLKEVFDSPEFRRHYSAYMLGEIKDQVSFYHTAQEYEDFLKFFSYLDGKYKFTYDEYLSAYSAFFSEIINKKTDVPRFFDTPEAFLQFLYELSIICYIQESEDTGERFISWCHRDRDSVNTSPKVKTGVRYEIHYGLGKALNVGKKLMRRT